jgi:tRNA-binding protein
MVDYAAFESLDIRVGTIVAAEPFERARRPAYKLTLDFGSELGTRRSSAQLVANYRPDGLIGRKILAVTNFAPKNIAGFESQVLVLGVSDANGNVVLATLERDAPNGARLY